ncbi:YicC/YloC family endoribonuclease [Paenibacillus elgii]
MVISMTGFGQAARTTDGFRIQIDLKSVNHRYCEIVVRMPREFARYENAVKAAVQQHVRRGRVDAFVTVERDRDVPQAVEIDWSLAMGYVQAAEQLRERLSLKDELSLRDLLAIPGLVAIGQHQEMAEERMEAELVACAAEAARELSDMREKEGAFLQNDLIQRIGTMEHYCSTASGIAPKVVQDYAGKLRARIEELLQQAPPDEQRLAMEIAVFADRASIAEELTRLQSHCKQFRELLKSSEPVGRKLDFLVQEMNREANTIGSKANHAQLAAVVVDMKAELEKMREQIQNIE